MRDSDHFGRPIRTIADVRAVLDSPRASFEEYLNCVYVCVAESAWDLYENASRMALEAAISAPRIQVPNLIEAAEHLVKAIMRRAEDLSDLGPRANEAMDLLESIEPVMSSRDNPGGGLAAFRTRTLTELSELRVLVADPSCDGLLRLCARLRKWVERPDLAVMAGERARTLEPNNPAALTSLGAAYADLGEYPSARQHLKTVLRADPDAKRAITALSRVEYATDNFNESHRLAKRAFELEPDSFSAHRLLSSAFATGDEEAFQEALEWASSLKESGTEFSEDGYLAYFSAKLLYEQAGKPEEALAALQAIVDRVDTTSIVRTKARRLINRIKAELRRRQGRFDLGEDEGED
jgi:tetratricopeptide (TPR) repeat protein